MQEAVDQRLELVGIHVVALDACQNPEGHDSIDLAVESSHAF